MTRVDRSRLPVPVGSGRFRFPAVVRRTLGNGLDVRAITHRNVPVVAVALLVRGGTAADPADRYGLAAFTADLLDEGSGGHSAIEVSERLARLGADFDVDVGADATVLSLTTLQRFLQPALGLLAEMVTAPHLTEEDIERVRKLRLERLLQLRDHAPAVAERTFTRLIYGEHPYGHTGLGTENSLAATAPDDLRGFHAAAFQPGNATLVIAADADADSLIDAVKEAFGGWNANGNSSLPRDPGRASPPPRSERPLVIVHRASAAQSELRIGHISASRDTPDYHALVLLNTILGGQFVSRVNMNLRQDKGYTYGVRTGFDLRLGLGPFVLQTSVGTDVTVPAIREARREIEEIRGARPATAEEREIAIASVTRGYPRGFETAQQVARAVSSLALHGLPDDYFESFVERVERVTLEDLARVAQQYLDPERLTTLIVGDHQRLADLPSLDLGEPLVVHPA